MESSVEAVLAWKPTRSAIPPESRRFGPGVQWIVTAIERILITGGGIAGLSLATALHRQGFAAELVERSKEWPAIGAGINLPANGVRTLRALGVGKAVEQAGAVIRR